MGHLVRALVVLFAIAYATGDLTSVLPGAGQTWMLWLCVGWVLAYLVSSWLPSARRLGWVFAAAALACAALSWWLVQQFPPTPEEVPTYTWPGAATIGAGAVAGRLLFLAGSWLERVPVVLIMGATLLAAMADPVLRSFALLDTSAVLVACGTVAGVAIAQRHLGVWLCTSPRPREQWRSVGPGSERY
ncbi:hypothetical protein [Mobilicoccus caccae]|uniref:Uncharacterized protein n=1 Tax=Mobilicoccus caccae TaxID=1859295 RepID=A0ABQ6ITC0_9MICO|nr:hypothetical protein [Mobilicoccus caccae]GMA39933.1 hypothetical protein GCM10025883_19780 [Mobilicoccus caccae]